MAIKSVALLQYPTNSGTTISGKTDAEDDNLLVSREYVTKQIYNASRWTSGQSYAVGALVQWGGNLYTCKKATSGTTAPSSDTTNWERTYPVLRKYTNSPSNSGVVEHNLGTQDITVQVYKDERASGADSPKWVPVMMNFEFDTESPTNKIVLPVTVDAADYRVVIIAAK